MAAPLTGLGRRGTDPPTHVCLVCGSARNAHRGYPGDTWYCTPCVPGDLRYPWEAGYAPPDAAPAMSVSARAAVLPNAAVDLFAGSESA